MIQVWVYADAIHRDEHRKMSNKSSRDQVGYSQSVNEKQDVEVGPEIMSYKINDNP